MRTPLKSRLAATVTTILLLGAASTASAEGHSRQLAAFLVEFEDGSGRTAGAANADGGIAGTRPAAPKNAAQADPEVIDNIRGWLLSQHIVEFEDAVGQTLGRMNADGRARLVRGTAPSNVVIVSPNGARHEFSLSQAQLLAEQFTVEECVVVVAMHGRTVEMRLLDVLASFGLRDAPVERKNVVSFVPTLEE